MSKGKEKVNPDSLPVDEKTSFDEVMAKTGQIVFEGHPAAEGEVDEEEEGKEAGGPGKKTDTEPVKEGDDKPKELPPEVRPPKTPKEEGKTEKTPDERLSELQKENETLQKRLSETQTKFHSNREENKRQREQNEKLAGQIQELMLLVTKKNLEPQTPKKSPEVELEESVGRALEEIENLDPSSSDYRVKSVKAWSGVLGKMRSMVNEELDFKINSAKSELTKQQEEQRKKDQEADEEKARTEQVTSYANERAAKAGLDMRTNIESTDADGNKVQENSPEYDMFWKFAGYAPGKTTDEKIEWTVNEVKKIKTRIAGPIVTAKEKAATVQKNNSVLERSGNRPAEVVEQEKPMSLGDALGKAQRTF